MFPQDIQRRLKSRDGSELQMQKKEKSAPRVCNNKKKKEKKPYKTIGYYGI